MNQNLNETKRCNSCRKIRLISEFYKVRRKLSTECVYCNRIKQQKYRDKNIAKGLTDEKRYCNICNLIKPLKEIFRDCSGYYRKYCIDCYDKYIPEEKHERDRLKYEKRRINERERKRKDARIGMIKAAKKRAKDNNLQFNINKEDIIIPEFCPILGIKIKSGIGETLDSSPSLDKIIPELGYVKGNICVISWRANALKRDGKLEEFEKIVKFLKEQKTINNH